MPDDRFTAVGEETSKGVQHAASVLEEELAKGLDDARRLQRQVIDSRRIDQADFENVTARFRQNAHDLISMMSDRLAEMRSGEVEDLTNRLTTDAHSVFDAVMDLVDAAPAVVNRLADRTERLDQRVTENTDDPPPPPSAPGQAAPRRTRSNSATPATPVKGSAPRKKKAPAKKSPG